MNIKSCNKPPLTIATLIQTYVIVYFLNCISFFASLTKVYF